MANYDDEADDSIIALLSPAAVILISMLFIILDLAFGPFSWIIAAYFLAIVVVYVITGYITTKAVEREQRMVQMVQTLKGKKTHNKS